MPNGVASPTFANNPVAVSYLSSGSQFALNLPFVPSVVQFWGGSFTWAWMRGMGFGTAYVLSGTAIVDAGSTGCVLDILDGSGVASTNIGTTTATTGLLIGTNSVVNSGAGLSYRGLIYR